MENIHAGLIGLAVDYLTRFYMGTPPEEAFRISLRGAQRIGQLTQAQSLLESICDLREGSIISACKLAGYDVCVRAGLRGYRPIEEIYPNASTIFNIQTMVQRSLFFFKKYGPIVMDGFTFEGGYTNIISSGDGDYLTEDTLWDCKVSGKTPTKEHTLQLLIYYLMGMHSIHDEFSVIKKLGIFNPRLNRVYLLEISQIPLETLETVEKEVIGYEKGTTV